MAGHPIRTGKAKLIGVLMPREGLFGPVSTGVAITEAARASGFATTMVPVPESHDGVLRMVRQLRKLHVRGLVIIRSTKRVDELTRPLAEEFPVSTITGDMLSAGQIGVHLGQREAARAVVEHLFDVGCRSVAHVAGPDDWFDAHQRVLGWQDAVDGRDNCRLVRVESWGSEAAFDAALSLFEDGVRPDGVFAANDLIALGVMRAAKQVGLSLPADLAVAGFDNIAGSAYFQPPLTSVEQPFAEAGRSAVDMLLAEFRGEVPGIVTYQPRLVVRASTADFASVRT